MSIIKNIYAYTLGEIFSKVIPFLILPYLTRKLGVAGYGQLSEYQVYYALCLVVISLSFPGSISKYFYRYGSKGLRYVELACYFYGIMLSIALITASLVYSSELLFYASIVAFSQTILNVQLAIRQCQKLAVEFIQIQITTGLTSAILTVILLELVSSSFEYRVIAIFFANISSFVFAFIKNKKKNDRKLNITKYRFKISMLYVLSFGLPLILHQFGYFMKGYLDRIIIIDFYSLEQLGLYSASFQIASVLSVIISAVNSAVVPYYYEKIKIRKIQKSDVYKYVLFSLIFVPIPYLFLLMIPDYVYSFILGSKYVGVSSYVTKFTIGLSLNIPYLIVLNFLLYHGKNKQIAFTTLATGSIYVLLVYILCGIDINYVPYAIAISNMFNIFFLSFVMRKIND
ncbi:oligosaccharide flippase family protein [Vibrio splendidus]